MTTPASTPEDRLDPRADARWYATPGFAGAAALLLALTLFGWIGATGQAGGFVDPPALPHLSVVQLLDDTGASGAHNDWRIARIAAQPQIVVIEFPTLAAQGEALNRIAALIEKPGAPRDRVLDDAELAQFIDAQGDDATTFLMGHDYSGADLAMFFRLADQRQLQLNGGELRLRHLLRQQRLLVERAGRPAGAAQPWALVSFTRVQRDEPTTIAGATIDADLRASVARHELSHGLYFVDAAYREHCRRFWRHSLEAAERERFMQFLGTLGYDRSNEELMINETQAFLMHTADARGFSAAALGVSEAELADLRARFAAQSVAGWAWLSPGG